MRLVKALYSGPEHRLPLVETVGVVGFAWGLALQADRARFVLVIVLQLVQSLGLGAGLLALRSVLGGVVSTNGALHLSTVASGLITIALISLGSTTIGLMSSTLRQVLDLKTSALASDRVAQAVTAADLRMFDDSAFHDRVDQAVWAARDYAAHLTTLTIMVATTVLRLLGVIAAVALMAWWLLPMLLIAAAPAIQVAVQRQRGDFSMRLELMENRRMLEYLLRLLTDRDTAKEVRAFDLADPLRQRMAARYAIAIDTERRFTRTFLWREIRARLFGALVLVGLVAAVLALADTGHLNSATAITTLGGAYLLYGQLNALTGASGAVGSPVLFVGALRSFIRIPSAPGRSVPTESSFTTLTADHITFTYPAADTPVLHDVCIELPAGQVIALVGENGSGKTTLAKILTGLYQPSAGTLLWDGEPIDDTARLRAVSTVLFQDFVRYKLTGAENIGLGRPDRLDNQQAIREAATTAGAHEFLAALPKSYQTILSTEFSDGVDLSTGQWQRVALARAYLRDAPLVVLDEPTAALDPKAEADLFTHIRGLYAGRTVLLITHRFATVRHADQIHVLDHGRITEHGTHSELLAHEGAYADLFRTQAAAYLDPAVNQ
ncbi:ABC transporter ATP-binding protein [Nocardia pseudobrasiliensis]|uniref:ABC transporter ATP-binding protein n=1 Tax=Nocardia pseudobrasiliensis TaxID=45979 RepID=UPI001472694B|nr:ABC transporter ATP-binding protein [Nocardia pseudobrasiliensis]